MIKLLSTTLALSLCSATALADDPSPKDLSCNISCSRCTGLTNITRLFDSYGKALKASRLKANAERKLIEQGTFPWTREVADAEYAKRIASTEKVIYYGIKYGRFEAESSRRLRYNQRKVEILRDRYQISETTPRPWWATTDPSDDVAIEIHPAVWSLHRSEEELTETMKLPEETYLQRETKVHNLAFWFLYKHIANVTLSRDERKEHRPDSDPNTNLIHRIRMRNVPREVARTIKTIALDTPEQDKLQAIFKETFEQEGELLLQHLRSKPRK